MDGYACTRRDEQLARVYIEAELVFEFFSLASPHHNNKTLNSYPLASAARRPELKTEEDFGGVKLK